MFIVPSFGTWTATAYSSSGTKTRQVNIENYGETTLNLDYTLTKIQVETQPNKVKYKPGEALDLTGLTVKAYYSDNTNEFITNYTTNPVNGAILTEANTNVIISYTDYGITHTDSFNIRVVAYEIYGATWNGSSSSVWTRTDGAVGFANPDPYVADGNHPGSSPFDDIMPWSGMVRETVSGLGELVKIPKYWYKWTRDGSSMKLQIANYNADGFYTSPAHADRGDGKGERDFVYVGRYHCSTSNYQSTSGVKPKASITRSTARSSIHNLNSNAWQLDYAMFWTVNMLYLVEFADWDSQSKIGYGCGNGSSTENSGKTDTMPYHTGTMQTSRTTYGTGIQYRYIEDWWANVLEWVDGIYFGGTSKKTVYVINKPASFSDSSGGTNVGSRATSSGYIKTWTNPTASGYQWALYPASINSSEAYVKDYCGYDSSGVVLCFGGGYGYQGASCGAFQLYGSDSASDSHGNVGCRLMYLP